MRTNLYKDKILKILNKNHLLSISGVQEKIGDADYSTIYRNIKHLTLEKKIKRVVFGRQKIMYEIVDIKKQHEHFLCFNCGDIKNIDILSENILLPAKYKISDVVVNGLCKKCN